MKTTKAKIQEAIEALEEMRIGNKRILYKEEVTKEKKSEGALSEQNEPANSFIDISHAEEKIIDSELPKKVLRVAEPLEIKPINYAEMVREYMQLVEKHPQLVEEFPQFFYNLEGLLLKLYKLEEEEQDNNAQNDDDYNERQELKSSS